MKADGPIGVPKTQARVHSLDKGELCLKTSWPPKTHPTTSRGESLLKEVLDFIFREESCEDNCRPTWLSGLELDRYYPDLGLAFEYQGFQHTYFVPDFHKSLIDLKAQKQRDKHKKKTCRERRIILVTIEYWALSIGQVCQRIGSRLHKRRKWPQSGRIQKIIEAVLPKKPNRLKERKAINAKCQAYKKMIKANYKSGKWVKRQAYQERKRLAR